MAIGRFLFLEIGHLPVPEIEYFLFKLSLFILSTEVFLLERVLNLFNLIFEGYIDLVEDGINDEEIDKGQKQLKWVGQDVGKAG